MQLTFTSNFNVITVVLHAFIFIIVAFFFSTLYRKMIKRSIWKALLVVFIGVFAFSIHLDTIRIPILPLGVWIVYWVLRRNAEETRWLNYRPFAWLGFLSNFLFLAVSLLALPLHNAIYSEKDINTFISDLENSKIMITHPSGENVTLNPTSFVKQLKTYEHHEFDSIEWYNEIAISEENPPINERFPYQLIGVFPKWGSGIQSIIYIEQDGKGLLITTQQNQLYYRTSDSILQQEGN